MLGGNRRGEGSLVINNTNVFAALETLRKKKKTDKAKGKGSSKAPAKEPEPEVFWAPTKLTAKSWADVDDEDDDDYYATTAPLPSVWGGSEPQNDKEKPDPIEESDSEEDILDEFGDDAEEEADHEMESSAEVEPVVKKTPEISLVQKEAERQLSKKEKKKKELAELEALLADFRVPPKEDINPEETLVPVKEKKEEASVEVIDDKKDNVDLKGAKKKKKKDKSVKDLEGIAVADDATGTDLVEEELAAVDLKERLKKMASVKKKKSSKEMDGAARAAAIEAAARSAKLAAAKKKEKNHYNQQPVR